MNNYRFFRPLELSWGQRKWWFGYLMTDIKNWWYRTVHGIDFNCRNVGSTPDPVLGDIVQVKAKNIIQINQPNLKDDFVRIIPMDYNHGVLVQVWKNGEISHGYNLGYDVLSNILQTHVNNDGDLCMETVEDRRKADNERNARTKKF